MLRASGDSLRALRELALLAVAYDTLMRESEAVALLISDLEFSPDGSGVVTIRRSKTDQEGQGMRRYIHIDTVSYLRQWLATAGHSHGAVFRSVPKGGRLGSALAAPEVARIFRRFAERAGSRRRGSPATPAGLGPLRTRSRPGSILSPSCSPAGGVARPCPRDIQLSSRPGARARRGSRHSRGGDGETVKNPTRPWA